MPILWRTAMELGVPLIDDDHRRLVSLLNRYEEAMTNREMDAVDATFNALAHYTKVHFEREEALHQKCGYPHAKAHRRSHQKLIAALMDMYRRHKASRDGGEFFQPEELYDFLSGWLVKHIIKEDLPVKPFLASQHHTDT